MDDGLARKVSSHLAMREGELVATGWSRAEARLEALRVFENREAVGRACTQIRRRQQRSSRRMRMLETSWQDARYAPDAPHAVLVSASFADRYWPG